MSDSTQQPQTVPQPPLRLEGYTFPSVHVEAPEVVVENASYKLGVTTDIRRHEGDTTRFLLTLRVYSDVGEDDKNQYRFDVACRGFFQVPEPRDDAPQIVVITGGSILFGAVRELLATITGRSGGGVITLPTVSPRIFWQAQPAVSTEPSSEEQ